jgi:hypothetical protein
LKQQNESLKAVIGEMRTQMEKLGQELPQVTLPEPVNKLSFSLIVNKFFV